AIRVWDVATGREIAPLRGQVTPIMATAMAPDARTLATAGADGAIPLWGAAAVTELRTLGQHRDALSVSFSPDGKVLASGGGNVDKLVRIWDVETNAELAQFDG